MCIRLIKRIFGFKEAKEEGNSMKYLIVGLGNPGPEYEETRHNIGFKILDQLAADQGCTFEQDRLGDLAQFKHKGRSYHLLKPNTYMNLSGKAVAYWVNKLGLNQNKLLVVLDDLNLPFETLRLRSSGKHGGHNGLKDIDQAMGTNKYARLRFGIGSAFKKGQQVDYVLGKWSPEEQAELPRLINDSEEAILLFGSIGCQRAMTTVNKKRES